MAITTTWSVQDMQRTDAVGKQAFMDMLTASLEAPAEGEDEAAD